MLIHADFSQAVIVKPEDYHWVKSPVGKLIVSCSIVLAMK